MRKIKLCVIVLLCYTINFAQEIIVNPILNEQCASRAIESKYNLSNPLNNLTYRTASTTNTQYVFNVKVHYINNNVVPSEQENKALDIIASLNLAFNQANIFFKFNGFDNLLDPSYLTIDHLNINTLYPTDTNNIEIYVPNVVLGPNTNGWCSIWRDSNDQITKSIIIIRKDRIPVVNTIIQTNVSQSEYTLVHEMGHYFGLYHTQQLWKLKPAGGYSPVNDLQCGLEENLDNSQWSYLGDLIQDTSPDRTDKYWSTAIGNPVVLPYNSNCSVNIAGYHNSTECNSSINLSLFNPPLNNIMSYHRGCRNVFTPNQYAYMRNYINLQSSNDDGTNGFLINKFNTIASLYQPYSGGYYSGIYNSNIPTPSIPKFQKGFDYKFIGCDVQPTKTLQTYTVNQIPIGHPYFQSIKIMQIDPNITKNCNIPYMSAYTGGQIISFDNILYNGNFTIENLNSTEIVNPNLKNELPNGHHIIKKNLNDGQTINENVIIE